MRLQGIIRQNLFFQVEEGMVKIIGIVILGLVLAIALSLFGLSFPAAGSSPSLDLAHYLLTLIQVSQLRLRWKPIAVSDGTPHASIADDAYRKFLYRRGARLLHLFGVVSAQVLLLAVSLFPSA